MNVPWLEEAPPAPTRTTFDSLPWQPWQCSCQSKSKTKTPHRTSSTSVYFCWLNRMSISLYTKKHIYIYKVTKIKTYETWKSSNVSWCVMTSQGRATAWGPGCAKAPSRGLSGDKLPKHTQTEQRNLLTCCTEALPPGEPKPLKWKHVKANIVMMINQNEPTSLLASGGW